MELDDLKQKWKQANTQKQHNHNIMELIYHKSSGPVAALKRRFRKQMILIPVLVAMIMVNFQNREIFTDVMFWCFMTFCLTIGVFFYLNYRLVSKMEYMDGRTKSNLEHQVAVLEKRLKWHMVGIRIMLLFFIILSEVLPWFADEPMLEKWHSVSPAIRLLVYAALLTVQYYLSRLLSQRRYGRHLSNLKQLLGEMQQE